MTTRWDQYDYEQLVEILSDYSKDVYGMRTRMNGEPREVIIDALCRIDADAPRVVEQEAQAQADHIEHFEQLVSDHMWATGSDRESVIHWLLNEEDYEGDYDYGCYAYNLPYGYFKDIQRSKEQ